VLSNAKVSVQVWPQIRSKFPKSCCSQQTPHSPGGLLIFAERLLQQEDGCPTRTHEGFSLWGTLSDSLHRTQLRTGMTSPGTSRKAYLKRLNRLLKRSGGVPKGRPNPGPSFDALFPSEAFMCCPNWPTENLIWTGLKFSRPYGTRFRHGRSHKRL
jgi:hypothetical protein